MQRVSPGYTILEVMIFLAVSAALLAAAMNFISGKQAQVDFDQKVRATQAQIQSWIGDVSNGFTGANPASQYCTVAASRPIVMSRPLSGNVPPQCVFLGKAIQFTDIHNPGGNPSKIYTYSVFGLGQQPDSYFDAQPAPACGLNCGQVGGLDLTDTFDLGSIQVKNVNSHALSPTGRPSSYHASHLVGFFSSFNTDQNSTVNGSVDLNAYQFEFDGSRPLPGDAPSNGGAALVQCLELTTSPSTPCFPSYAQLAPNNWPEKLQNIQVCLSGGPNQTALLTISSNDGIGATTKLDFILC